MTDEAQLLRQALRAELTAAMKARQPDAVSVLRSAIAAIENAEAVEPPHPTRSMAGDHFAGSRLGLAATEAERRDLTVDDVRAILRKEVGDRLSEAARYDAYGELAAGDRLRREADVLNKHLLD